MFIHLFGLRSVGWQVSFIQQSDVYFRDLPSFPFSSPKCAWRQSLRSDFFHLTAIQCKKCCRGIMLGGTKQRRKLIAEITGGAQRAWWANLNCELFHLERETKFLTLEGLVALWATSGLCIPNICEHTGLWTSGDQQPLLTFCTMNKHTRATGEM